MQGRIKRKQSQALAAYRPAAGEAAVVCPLCERAVPAKHQDAHHLLPKSRGGVDTVVLHRLCHRQIHALFSLVELEREYASIEALRSHPDMARFIDWVRNKPDDFFERTRKSQRMRKR